MLDRASDLHRVGQSSFGTSKMSSIKTDELINSVQNTFHYADMTGGKAFIYSERNVKWDCVNLPKASETLFFSNSPITRNHKLTNRPNGLAKWCRHERRYFWKTVSETNARRTADLRYMFLLSGAPGWTYSDLSFHAFSGCPCTIFLLWRCVPTLVMASSFLRFLDHTQRRTTVGRTPLNEWSARRRDFYLHSTQHSQQKNIHAPVGFEPTNSAGERPKTYALNRAATGTGAHVLR